MSSTESQRARPLQGPTSQDEPPTTRTFAVVAFVFAAVLACMSPLQSIAETIVQVRQADASNDAMQLIGYTAVVIIGVLATLAFILGVVSLVRREPARALAGAAVGIAAAGFIGLVSAAVQTAIVAAQ